MKKVVFILFLSFLACMRIGREIPQNAEKGGEIAIGLSEDFESLVPMYPSLRTDNSIFDLIFYPLIRIEKERVYPGIAKEWEFSEDLKSITFYLRKNAKWHDGNPVTAKDFVFTFNRVMDKNSNSSLKVQFRNIKSIKAIDDYTLKIEFKRVYSSQLYDCEIYPLPEHILKNVTDIRNSQYNIKPVGCGPYVVKEHRRGDILILEKFEDFFEKSPFIEKITFKIYPSPLEIAQALKMDLIDIALDLNSIAIDSFLLDWEGGEIDYYPSKRVIYLAFNLNKEPFNNRDIRRAILMLINNSEIIQKVFSSYAIEAKSIFSPAIWAFDTTLPSLPFGNADKAVTLLSSYGYSRKNPLKMEIIIDNSQPIFSEIADIIKTQLEASNIVRVDVKKLDPVTFTENLLNSNFTSYIFSWVSDERADPTIMIHSKGLLNFTGYKNSYLDSLLTLASTSLRRKKVREYLKEVQKIIQEDLPLIPLCIPEEIYAVNYRLKGWEKFSGELLLSNLDIAWIPSGERKARLSFELPKEEKTKEAVPKPEERKRVEREVKEPVEPAPIPPVKTPVTAEEILRKKVIEEAAKKEETTHVAKKEEIAKPQEKVETPKEETPPPQIIPAVSPVVKKKVAPEYPEIAKKLNAHGVVRLRVFVDKDGKVKDVKVLRSSGFEFLDNAAKEAALQYEFEPAKDQNGKPIAVWFPLSIRF